MEFNVILIFLCIAFLMQVRELTTATRTTVTADDNGGSERDRTALLAFKSNIKYDPEGVMSSWNSSIHFCEWQGITCSRRHKRVTSLDLRSSGLVGTLSPYIGNLSFLWELRLSYNTIHGKIPPELGRLFRLQFLGLTNNFLEGEIPSDIFRCSNLVNLHLRNNKLVRKIPEELGSLAKLKVLAISENNLTGGIPSSIGNLTSLEYLVADTNKLGGSIPDVFHRLKTLKFLGLGVNQLSGNVPPSLYNLSHLTVLSLAENQLHGSLPPNFGLLFPHLQVLQIRNNNFTGSIPYSFSNASKLESIEMNSNKFGGSIPDVFHRLKTLKFLALGANEFSGILPPSLYNLSHLTVLSLPENQLHGLFFPPNFGLFFPLLQTLQIRNNNFTGSIPSSLSNASQLQSIQMENNNFVGKVSLDFSSMKHLSWMDAAFNNLGTGDADDMKFLTSLLNCSNLKNVQFQRNHFGGSLPNSIANLSTQITFLGFSENQISGFIPTWIGSLTGLTNLGLDHNKFVGPIPDAIGNLQNLYRMLLNANRLSGKIPTTLGNLSSLNILALQNNILQGTIPSSLGKCKNLFAIGLCQNHLGGIIPKKIFNISTLVILHLRQNQLVGFLPSEVGNLKRLGELYVSENKLYGQIPSNLGGCSSLESLSMEGNSFSGSIPLSLSSLRGIRAIDLSRNNLSGEIPDYLERFALTYLNLASNDFEGEVPTKGVFTNATAVSVLRNKRLCGGIAELNLPSCYTKESKKQNISSLPIVLIITSVCVILGVTLVVAFIYFQFKKKRKEQPSESLKTLWKVSYAVLLKATDGFSTTNLIGVGSFGSVYKGILDQDEQIVAIKVFNLKRRGASKSFLAECEALRNIRHRNLVKIITSCSSVDFQGNEFKALVYEFMPNGSLETWVHPIPESSSDHDRLQKLNLLQRINISIAVASGLEYLHCHCQPSIIHCDLKPSNILLDSDMIAHVGDFGLAKFLPEFTTPNQSSSMGIRGTIGYAAPEYGLGSEVSRIGDVYSFGILLLEIMTGKKPTNGLFEEGHNLHNFAKLALPDRVMEIVDPILSSDVREEVVNNSRSLRQGRNENTRLECLISMVKIGVACSMESPQDRMDISSVVRELHLVGDVIQSIEIRQQRQREIAGPSEEV